MVVFKQFLDNCVPVIVRPKCSSGMGKVKAIVNVWVFPRSDIKSNAIIFFMPTSMTTMMAMLMVMLSMKVPPPNSQWSPCLQPGQKSFELGGMKAITITRMKKEKGIFVDTLPKAGNINDPLLMLYTERDIGRDINGHNGQLAGVTRMRRYRKRRISADVNSIYAFRGKEG